MAYYLKAEGITGGSTKKGFEGTMEIMSMSYGGSRSSTSRSGEGGAGGEIIVQDFHLQKSLDAASPELFKRCATGEPIKKATLTCLKSSGGVEVKFLEIKLTNVYVMSVQVGGSGGQGSDVTPTESLSLSFKTIEYIYTGQKDDNTKGKDITVNWDVGKSTT
jgi:type VI secretion system secreted protein Hcp